MQEPRTSTCLAALIAGLLFAACAPSTVRLEPRQTAADTISGTYTLILHGCSYGHDPETIAFMRREDQPFTLQPYSPEFQYRTRTGVPAAEALAKARSFVNCSPYFSHSTLRAIVGPEGGIIGYEIRPIYHPIFSRWPDLLDVHYAAEGQQVTIYIIPRLIEDDKDDDN